MTTTEVEVDNGTAHGAVSGPGVDPSGAGYISFDGNQPYPTGSAASGGKSSLLIPGMIGLLALVAAGIAGTMFLNKSKLTTANTFQDLGAGVSNATGIKGALQVRWQNNRVEYQLKLEPIDPIDNPGFSDLLADPPSQYSINMRILDITGFALCSKQIVFHYGGANASGNDVFQNAVTEDGKVTAANAQGVLPCSADQFRQASYWDFSTDFPTLDKQEALVKKSGAGKARQDAEVRATQRRANARTATLFTTEGDDRASGYDGSRNVLEARLGRDFQIMRASDRTIAEGWATGDSLFHYRCDQHARCTLTHAGGNETINVVALQ